jgi:uncharacterized protein (DUF697 family)
MVMENMHVNGSAMKDVEMEETTFVPSEESDERGQSIIRQHVYAAMGAGLIPMPMVDLLSITGVQLNMLRRLAQEYNVPFRKDLGKSVIAALVGGAVPVTFCGPVASAIKMIPLVGWTTAGLTMSLFGGASTYAIGKVFAQHFASGGTFLDLDPTTVREYFAEKLKEGQEFVSSKR